ncbi:MAG: RNase P subunit p30 family protein [Promethearchaeota archaeon]
MPIDLNIAISDSKDIDSILAMGMKLGFRGIAVSLPNNQQIENPNEGIRVFSRYNIHEKSLGAAKRELKQNRSKFSVVAFSLGPVNLSNWAAEETGVDLLTVAEPLEDCSLRDSTAKLAASTGTALELPVFPLLQCSGLARSKILKVYRETAKSAMDAGMRIIISSGCKEPICMRAPMAMSNVGTLIGLDRIQSTEAVFRFPRDIVEANLRKSRPELLGVGMELIRRGETK